MGKISGVATDNLGNRNMGRFSLPELYRIAALLPGVPLTFDHSDRYHDKRGRISSASVEPRPTPTGRTTPPEGYFVVVFDAEFDGEEELHVGDGISISTLYTSERCANCDCEVQDWQKCPRSIDEVFSDAIERVGVQDVLEVSLVLIPAVKGAAVENIENAIDSSDNTGEDKFTNQDSTMSTKTIQYRTDDVFAEDSVKVKKSSTPAGADALNVTADSVDAPPAPDTQSSDTPDISSEPLPTDSPAGDGGVTLTPEEVAMIAQTQEELKNKVAALEAQLAESHVAAESVKAEAIAAKKAAEAAELKIKLGAVMPGKQTMFNSVSGAVSSDRLLQQGLLGEWNSIRESADSKQVVYDRGLRVETHRDQTQEFQFWRQHKDALRPEIERLAKADGFLLGSRDAATAKADISSMLLDHLSMMIRTTHQANRVYWQFPTTVEDFSRGPGDVIQIPRWTNNAEPTATSDFTLTPGTALNTSLQNLATSEVSITLQELGLGKSGVNNFEPVGIPEFWMSRSMYSLEQAVMNRLAQSYEVCLDFLIRTQYFTTTAILYNDNNAVTTVPGDVGVGDGGDLTKNFLYSLYAYMMGQKVPTMPDGCYALVLHSTAAGQLRQSLGDDVRPTTMADFERISNILPGAATQGNVTGYLGQYCNFHVFETNAHSLGANGTEGAQNVNLGVGATLTRSSLAFGAAAVGRGIAMQPQIRRDSNDDFGRLGKFVWISHEAVATMDVDPNNDASEQQRVFEVRTIDVAV